MSVTKSGFIKKVEDITTHPTRMQHEVAGETVPEGVNPLTIVKTIDVYSPVPSIMILERIIKWYRMNSVESKVPEVKVLFDFTANKLEELLKSSYVVSEDES